MKRLFLVRHGETDMNVAEIFSGHIEAMLTDNGRSQAKNAGLHIKENLPKIDCVIASPLIRAHETAKIIAKEIGYPTRKIETNPIFMERHFGVLEGTSHAEFLETHSRQDLDLVERAETVADVQARADQALRFVQAKKADNILVVAHGSFGRAFWRAVNELPHTHEYEGERWRIGNAEVVELI